MNTLPDHRRAIHARTHSQVFRHADYAGFEHYRSERSWFWAHVVIGCIGVGVLAALAWGVL